MLLQPSGTSPLCAENLNSIGIKVARVIIGLLRKLKYTLPMQVLRSIYNSLI